MTTNGVANTNRLAREPAARRDRPRTMTKRQRSRSPLRLVGVFALTALSATACGSDEPPTVAAQGDAPSEATSDEPSATNSDETTSDLPGDGDRATDPDLDLGEIEEGEGEEGEGEMTDPGEDPGATEIPPTPDADEPVSPEPDETPEADAASGGSTFNPVAGDWILTRITAGDETEITIDDDRPPTLSVQGTSARIFYGCNSGGGEVEYDIAGDSFSASDLQSTLMACAGDGGRAMELERHMSEGLWQATSYAAGPGTLTISGGPSTLWFELVENGEMADVVDDELAPADGDE